VPGPVKDSRQVEDGRGVSVIRWAGRAIAAWAKPRADLIAENLCLRQQLLVLERRTPRPRCATATDGSGFSPVDGFLDGESSCSSFSRTPCSAGIAGDGRPIGGGDPGDDGGAVGLACGMPYGP
jgi:hypothetical protein